MLKNLDQVKKLAKVLLLTRFSSNIVSSRKTKYFNILKVKKIRETSISQFDNHNQNQSDSLELIKNESKKEFDNFFHYNFTSESDDDSVQEEISPDSVNIQNHVFNNVFNTNFVSINQFKEDDEDFIDLSSNINNSSGSSQFLNQFTNLSMNTPSTIIEHNNSNNNSNDLKASIFTEDEIKELSHIYEEIKLLNRIGDNEAYIKDFISLFEGDSKKKKYKILTAEEKKKLVELAKEFNAKEISKKYGVPLKSLKRWLLLGHERKKGAGRKEKDPEMEELLYEWYKDFHIKNKNQVTSKIIKQKALELTKYNDFLASKDWFNKFKKKYNIEIIKETEFNKLLK